MITCTGCTAELEIEELEDYNEEEGKGDCPICGTELEVSMEALVTATCDTCGEDFEVDDENSEETLCPSCR